MEDQYLEAEDLAIDKDKSEKLSPCPVCGGKSCIKEYITKIVCVKCTHPLVLEKLDKDNNKSDLGYRLKCKLWNHSVEEHNKKIMQENTHTKVTKMKTITDDRIKMLAGIEEEINSFGVVSFDYLTHKEDNNFTLCVNVKPEATVLALGSLAKALQSFAAERCVNLSLHPVLGLAELEGRLWFNCMVI